MPARAARVPTAMAWGIKIPAESAARWPPTATGRIRGNTGAAFRRTSATRAKQARLLTVRRRRAIAPPTVIPAAAALGGGEAAAAANARAAGIVSRHVGTAE